MGRVEDGDEVQPIDCKVSLQVKGAVGAYVMSQGLGVRTRSTVALQQFARGGAELGSFFRTGRAEDVLEAREAVALHYPSRQSKSPGSIAQMSL